MARCRCGLHLLLCGAPPLSSFVGLLKVMRIACSMFAVLVAVLPTGCAHSPTSLSWGDHSALPFGESVASLNAVVASSASSPDEKAKAIFTLFAQHIRPGSTAEQVHSVVMDTNWMASAYVYGVGALGGSVPVELTPDDSVFILLLFRESRPANPWHICFRLSGKGSSGSIRSDEEASAFLRGDTTLQGSPRLLEFALCFPDATEYHGRIERYGPKGIHVYEPVR